jgi:hypothetical protein
MFKKRDGENFNNVFHKVVSYILQKKSKNHIRVLLSVKLPKNRKTLIPILVLYGLKLKPIGQGFNGIVVDLCFVHFSFVTFRVWYLELHYLWYLVFTTLITNWNTKWQHPY